MHPCLYNASVVALFFGYQDTGVVIFLSYDVNGERLSPNDDLFSDLLLVLV